MLTNKELQDNFPAQEVRDVKKTKLVTLSGLARETTHSSSEVIIQLPVPYQLPPLPYSSEGCAFLLTYSKSTNSCYVSSNYLSFADEPWSWDRQYFKKDVYGQVWPRM